MLFVVWAMQFPAHNCIFAQLIFCHGITSQSGVMCGVVRPCIVVVYIKTGVQVEMSNRGVHVFEDTDYYIVYKRGYVDRPPPTTQH